MLVTRPISHLQQKKQGGIIQKSTLIEEEKLIRFSNCTRRRYKSHMVQHVVKLLKRDDHDERFMINYQQQCKYTTPDHIAFSH